MGRLSSLRTAPAGLRNAQASLAALLWGGPCAVNPVAPPIAVLTVRCGPGGDLRHRPLIGLTHAPVLGAELVGRHLIQARPPCWPTRATPLWASLARYARVSPEALGRWQASRDPASRRRPSSHSPS
jgi:hypothetical protein